MITITFRSNNPIECIYECAAQITCMCEIGEDNYITITCEEKEFSKLNEIIKPYKEY